jgi:NAD(P)-dependent dehydrogenase (short-subunit alcohol dehydrogenase family)
MYVKGSKVLVTGANRGIGRAIVEALLEREATTVYAAARRPATVADLAERDRRVVPVELDLHDPTQIAAATALAADTTLLINNAGALAFTDPLGGDLAEIVRDFQTNFYGTLAATRAFVPVLERNGGGAIVNVLSLVVFGSIPALAGYSASKAAASSMTQALRAQLAGRDITVHAVFPGTIDTDMTRAFDMPKTSPAEAAHALLDGLEAGRDNIFPDPMSRGGYDSWRVDPSAFERQMSAIG